VLRPGGRLIGTAGAATDIRIVRGGLEDAQKLFNQLAEGGQPIAGSSYPGTAARPSGGGFVGLRTITSGTGARATPVATIDVKVPGIRIREIKFVP
jgi:hypothetical protein